MGEQNAHFATQFLKDEQIPIVGASTGGDHGRKLECWPVSGRARQYPLNRIETQMTVALEHRPVARPKPAESSIKLF